MRTVSNTTLVREVRKTLKTKRVKVRTAVEWAFMKRRLYNPKRFGEICRLVEQPVLSTPQQESYTYYWEKGNLA